MTNSQYDKIQMNDLEEVKENHQRMKRHFAYLGIEEVIEAEDSHEKFEHSFTKIRIKVEQAFLSKIKLFLYVYYAGHGVMYNSDMT